MQQQELNKANINDWEYENKYEKLFELPLTSKHALSVGRWNLDGYKGIDLRRWSYDQSRNLGEGITLFEDMWLKLFNQIIDLFNRELFLKFSKRNESKYIATYKIDKNLKIITGTFIPPGMRNKYFCITMFKNDKIAYRGRYAAIKIMIRFETVNDFIIKCKEYCLVPYDISLPGNSIDKNTGKKVF